MGNLKENLQDEFLSHLCKHKGPATIFLVNGVKLQGVITAFNDMTVLLRREAHEQLVYKHAISTIMPHAKISLIEDEQSAPSEINEDRDR
ncbi:MAG: RNA chaperone Hfq [Alphaproteobacteria bacterium]|nr:RNA chaperone Hfq [Alphaproteobacteria bacterium]